MPDTPERHVTWENLSLCTILINVAMVHLSSHGTLNLPRMENIEQGKLKDIFRYISHQMLFCNVFSQLEKIDDAYRKNN